MNRFTKIAFVFGLLFFGSFSFADGNVTKSGVVIELYNLLSKEDSDIDSTMLVDLEKMLKDDGTISIDELKDEFGDELISSSFIDKMKSNPILAKEVKYSISDDSIDNLLDSIEDSLKNIAEHDKNIAEYDKNIAEYDKLGKGYKGMLEKLGGNIGKND